VKKYYVNLPDGTKDAQFQQVLELLIAEGFKTDDSRDRRRVRQSDGSYEERGFLYLFDDRGAAESFARKVRERTGEAGWKVFEVDVETIQELIEEHLQIKDEPLVLAMFFDAGENPDDIYLLEIIKNFGSNEINPDRELFELTYWAPKEQKTWHLILTNPPEFDAALRGNWKHAEKIRRAVNAGRFEVLYMTEEDGVRSRELIHA
jgi:hypothetical protein